MVNKKIVENKKPPRAKYSSQGFTLIELIITVIAIGIFGGITANILANASKVYSDLACETNFCLLRVSE
jgi:prepilin-type N-terminal cleavage/methylation domain-containing protein